MYAIIAYCNIVFQLRYLQTLNSISAENNSTIVFPVPVDIISSILPIKKVQAHTLDWDWALEIKDERYKTSGYYSWFISLYLTLSYYEP